MSQDDQRNQPNEEPAGDAGAEHETPAERTGSTVERRGPTAATATAAARAALLRSEFREQPDEGAPRYAETADEAPRSGSEESWSAAPHPGYQPDPAINYPAKRVVAGTLIGALLMAGFTVYAVRILTNRSGNGNGSAPWTAAVERNGAVLGGINAQNNGSAHEIPLPADLTYGNSGVANADAVNRAVVSCRTAHATTVPVTTVTGTAQAVHGWAAQANPTLANLRLNAANLENAVSLGHVAAVAAAANSLCSVYPAIGALPPMPDAAGSQAWSAAVTAYADAATQSIRGASGTISAKPQALDSLAAGDKALDELSARIATVG